MGLSGSDLIAAERQRQVAQEGWTPEHDDSHIRGQIAQAAECYVHQARVRAAYLPGKYPPFWWPWDSRWWKPSGDPVRDLVKAGALIAAEIDRLQRIGERHA